VYLVAGFGQIGTGFLFEPGLILTNHHVIVGNSTVEIWDGIGNTFTGTVVASDTPRDLALIRINPTDTSAIPLTLASTVGPESVAKPVLAIGYSNTEAVGNIGSAGANVGVVTRLVTIDALLGRGFEMDAPVDPGDSGGPILNQDGEVIGISRAVVVATAGGQRVVGTFLAIAIDEVHVALPVMRAGISR
jgi:putative serine protease PepD|tara:strand:+ start:569 stop:1138 length:570 start_codon:yes stop_codon:yes gene_type:complete